MTYIAQRDNPFILNMNLNELNKQKLELLNKEKESEYVSSISSKYKNEIIFLKNYIQKINTLIRDNLNLDIFPLFEEAYSSISKKINSGDYNSEDLQTLMNEWMNRIINVEYINPLATLYETYIKNLEAELINHKETNKKYENLIHKLIQENNDLRNKLIINEEELKNIFEVRNESKDSMIIMDRDYVMKLEEKNQLLSKENGILMMNLNKLQNDLLQVKGEMKSYMNESNDNKLINLQKENIKLKNDYKNIIEVLDANKQKVKEMADNYNSIEVKNLELNNKNNDLEQEVNILRGSSQRYKSLLLNNNNKDK